MHMQIEVIDVNPTSPLSAKTKKPYDVVEITYKDQGKVYGYKQMKFKNEALYNEIVALSKGDVVDVHKEKIGEYWDWTEVNLASDAAEMPVVNEKQPNPSKVSAYVPDADKQRLIVRQATLKAAIAFYELQGQGATFGDVVETAGCFEQFVYGTLPTLPVNIDDDFIPA